jgi:hypothetical protein
MESKHIEELRCIAPQGGIALSDAVQEIEILRLSELLCFGDTRGEVVPRENGFDRCERIAAGLFGFKKRLTHSSVKPDLVVDSLA